MSRKTSRFEVSSRAVTVTIEKLYGLRLDSGAEQPVNASFVLRFIR